MNNLYIWQDERMVNYEREEVRRAVEQARLLREAGLSGNDGLLRAVKLVSGWITAAKERLQGQGSIQPGCQPSGCENVAG